MFLKRMWKSPKLKPTNLLHAWQVAARTDVVLVRWSCSRETKLNFGDALNPFLIEHLSGKQPVNANHVPNFCGKPVYSVIGSILDNVADNRLVVWGSGFKRPGSRVRKRPQKILAVRGPLTRKNLLEQGIDCPEVYGDPALLCPMFFPASKQKRYRLGIIPHYVDKASSLLKPFDTDKEVKIIDVESGVRNVIAQITECELVASSSLHGVIVADAYMIPSLWIVISDKIAGGGFKFKDYMYSVGKGDGDAYVVSEKTTSKDLISHIQKHEIRIDLGKLLEVCPFRAQRPMSP